MAATKEREKGETGDSLGPDGASFTLIKTHDKIFSDGHSATRKGHTKPAT